MQDNSNKTVFVGMSGGVDSSVSALLLKNAGYQVVGVYMKNWSRDLPGMKCPWAEDLADAKRVATKLDIDFRIFDFEEEYHQKVVDYMLAEFKKGNTPNPDIMCNQEIKFKLFYEVAKEQGADMIATGHYANSIHGNLKKAVDQNKDQTYFLSRIGQKALSKTIFPIGDIEKSKVRDIAKENNLATALKKDSTGVCFIGERDFDKFLDKYLLSKKGDMVNVDDGKKIGTHNGLIHYTLGQRKGLGIGGIGSGEPWFVVGKNLEKNILYIAQGEEHEALYTKSLIGEEPFWILEREPKFPLKCTAKFRYRQKDIPVTVYKQDDGNVKVVYDYKVKAVTKGQVAVFYDGDYCIGSAIISEIEPIEEKYKYLNK